MEILFGSIEEHLRRSRYPSVPDRKIDLDGHIMYVSGICVYLPRFDVTVHEGFICKRGTENEKFEPEYVVTAILDKKSGELLYDEEADFVECVYGWLDGKISIAELEQEKCSVEGIGVREHEQDIPAVRGGRGH